MPDADVPSKLNIRLSGPANVSVFVAGPAVSLTVMMSPGVRSTPCTFRSRLSSRSGPAGTDTVNGPAGPSPSTSSIVMSTVPAGQSTPPMLSSVSDA
jgi:hypothetical protein